MCCKLSMQESERIGAEGDEDLQRPASNLHVPQQSHGQETQEVS